MKPCLVYIISLVSQSNLFNWTAERLVKSGKYRLVFILLHEKETAFEQYLRSLPVTVHRISYRGKKDAFRSVRQIRNLLKQEKADIVHSHLFDAGLLGMMAARFAGVNKRIHTRHDATIHHRYHPHAVKYDRLTNRFATQIIAITANVRDILEKKEHVPSSKIRLIPHGFYFDPMLHVSADRVLALEKKYFPSGKPGFVVGAVSRFMEWKGLQYLIPAFEKLRNRFPEAHLLLANAGGPYSETLQQQLDRLPENSYTLVSFESDIFALFRLMDVFVHLPVDAEAEAFGQVYVEAMACGIPSVVTLSGVAPEFIEEGKDALVVPYRNSDAVYDALVKLKNDPALRNFIGNFSRNSVLERFRIESMMEQMEKMYDG